MTSSNELKRRYSRDVNIALLTAFKEGFSAGMRALDKIDREYRTLHEKEGALIEFEKSMLIHRLLSTAAHDSTAYAVIENFENIVSSCLFDSDEILDNAKVAMGTCAGLRPEDLQPFHAQICAIVSQTFNDNNAYQKFCQELQRISQGRRK